MKRKSKSFLIIISTIFLLNACNYNNINASENVLNNENITISKNTETKNNISETVTTTRKGEHVLEYSEEINFGNRYYNLISVD